MDFAVHYNEIGLKGRNRPRFEQRLASQLRRVLEDLGATEVRALYGRLFVRVSGDVDATRVQRRIASVFGVAYFARASFVDPTPEAIEKAVDQLVERAAPFESFGIRARRVEKRHPFRSNDLARRLGDLVRTRTGARVDLTRPALWIEVHVLSREAVVFCERVAGPGGMPVGSAGRAIALISGGIDSPVAAREMMKRGLRLAFVHFHSSPFTSEASQDKVRDLIARLAVHQGRSRLYLVPFAELQQRLASDAPGAPRIVLYRRFMLRIAEALARRSRAGALVTGESLGQVSSQTLGNLDTINRVADLPVLRPLIGRDKNEIIALAQTIGTYEISIEPDEDCCGFLMPQRPATWTRPEEVESIEAGLDPEALVQEALSRVQMEEVEPTGDL